MYQEDPYKVDLYSPDFVCPIPFQTAQPMSKRNLKERPKVQIPFRNKQDDIEDLIDATYSLNTLKSNDECAWTDDGEFDEY